MSFSVAFRRWFAVGLLCLGASLAFASPVYADPPESATDARLENTATVAPSDPAPAPSSTLTPFTPQLSVPIPGIQFTTPTMEGNFVSVPFLAQYITGIYRYVLGLSTIFGIIAVIVGGFYYLVGETVGDANRGKSIIQDALFGLIVLYSASFILSFVNPGLTSLRPLQLASIDSISIEIFADDFLEIPEEGAGGAGGGTSRNLTGGTGGPGYGSSRRVDPGTCPIPNLPAGHIDCGPGKPRPCPPGHCVAVGRADGCTDNAVANSSDARYNAFVQGLPAVLTAPAGPARVQQAARVASACQIHIGSCNASAQAVRNFGGMSGGPSRTVNVLDGPGLPNPGDFICDESCRTRGAGCSENSLEAVNRVRNLVRAQQDTRAAALRPGDHLYVFNGSHQTSCGEHSILFVGWESEGSGQALILQSQWGDTLHMNRVCLKTTCGTFLPITQVTPAVMGGSGRS